VRMAYTVSVLGAGSWGTALATVAARRDHRVYLWGRRQEQVEHMFQTRKNPDYLRDYNLPQAIIPTCDMERAVQEADLIIAVVASVGMRDMINQLSDVYYSPTPIVSATKGLEPETHMRMTEVIAEEMDCDVTEFLCSLSGPNFADEIVRGLPAGTVIASEHEEHAIFAQKLMTGTELRVYTTDDLIGVELGGALKNIYAIGAGIADGMDLGYNVQATMITRGLAELTRMGIRKGAHPLTFSGLSGLGDMVLTCTSDLSRNRRTGLALGQGKTAAEVMDSKETVEGIRATRAAKQMADKHKVEMPIIEQLHNVLFDGKDPAEAIEQLMKRAAKTEREDEFVAATRSFMDESGDTFSK